MKSIKRIIFFVLLSALFLSFAIQIFAHQGKTDFSGGHYDRTTGEYHYHHGYPAHQHINGECPYNFDDNADHSRSFSGSGGNSWNYSHKTYGKNVSTEDIFKPMNIPEYDSYTYHEEKSKSVYYVCGFCAFCSVAWLFIQFLIWRDEHGNEKS